MRGCAEVHTNSQSSHSFPRVSSPLFHNPLCVQEARQQAKREGAAAVQRAEAVAERKVQQVIAAAQQEARRLAGEVRHCPIAPSQFPLTCMKETCDTRGISCICH